MTDNAKIKKLEIAAEGYRNHLARLNKSVQYHENIVKENKATVKEIHEDRETAIKKIDELVEQIEILQGNIRPIFEIPPDAPVNPSIITRLEVNCGAVTARFGCQGVTCKNCLFDFHEPTAARKQAFLLWEKKQ